MSHPMRVVFTGGGTAGHVTPNLALIAVLQQEGAVISYVGSADGVEKPLVREAGVPFYAVKSGKLRRYFSWKNVFDPLNIVVGIWQSFWLLRRLKPDLLFSKGGFVAFPVVVGAWLNRIPIVAHESDFTPGLANRLSFPFVKTLCVTFSESKKHISPLDKVVVTGTPIREDLFHGDKARGLQRCGFLEDLPCLLVMGGSQGAEILNACVRDSLGPLCARFQIIHVCGEGKVSDRFKNQARYCQIGYAKGELADYYAASDLVISRAGANSVCEILALAKPHIFIPLSVRASRGDQIQNARYFEEQGLSIVVPEETLSTATLMAAIDKVVANDGAIRKKLKALGLDTGTENILQLIRKIAHA